MADIPYIQQAQEVKITGQDTTGTTVNYVSADANGNLLTKDYADGPVTAGAVASASQLVGGQYNTTVPTPTTAQQVAIQLNQFGALSVSHRNKFKNLTGNATTTIKSGSGVLNGIMINNNTSGGTITIYDNTAGSGTIIATITMPTGGVNPVPTAMTSLGIEYSTGLTTVTAGATANNFTILYQ